MKIKGKNITPAQLTLKTHLEELGVNTIFEYQFVKERKFSADLADLENSILFECDGGQHTGGHMRRMVIERQYEKDRLAQLYGFRMMRFTNRQILCGEAKRWLQEHLYPF